MKHTVYTLTNAAVEENSAQLPSLILLRRCRAGVIALYERYIAALRAQHKRIRGIAESCVTTTAAESLQIGATSSDVVRRIEGICLKYMCFSYACMEREFVLHARRLVDEER